MKRSIEAGLFFVVAVALLLFQFRGLLVPGHYVYLAVIEDPAARFSFFPWDILSARELRAGHFPLWNPYSGTGMPLWANLQSSVLMPLKWLYFIWPSVRALDLFVILRLALAGTFAFMLGRALRLSPPAAALAGVAFMLSGYMMKHMNMVNVSSEMWLPLILFLLLKQKARPSLWLAAVSALAWALVLSGGNPEAAFYTTIFAAGFTAVVVMDRRERIAPAAWLIVPFLLGAILGSAQLWPFLEYLGQGFHIHGPGLHLMAPFSPRLMASLIAPWLLGPSGSNPLQVTSSPYIGVAVLALASIGAVHAAGRSRPVLFFGGAALVLLAIIYRLPPISLITWLPPFNMTGNVKFAMAGVTLSAAVLAGTGLESFDRGRARGRKISLALAITSVMLFAGAFYIRRTSAHFEIAGLIAPVLSLLAVSAILVLFLNWGPRGNTTAAPATRKAASWAIAIFCALELLVLFRGFTIQGAMAPEMVRFKDPAPPEALLAITRDRDLPRFTGMAGALHDNLNLIFSLSDLRAFDGIYPARYVTAMGEIEGFTMDRAVENFFSHGWSFDVAPRNLVNPLMDVLGVKYVASKEAVSAPGFALIRDGRIKVYENQEAWPRAWMESNGIGRDAARPVAVKSYLWDRVDMEARGPGALVLADTYFPGWRARVDESEKKITASRGLLRGVELGPGRREIKMSYRPRAFQIGLWASVAGLMAMAAALGLASRAKKMKVR
ncbi:MAG TPA: hypothetical protein VM658_01805 [bacterium]|nr:hypothetical protein [bacterium]